jgi:hypothetical protein
MGDMSFIGRRGARNQLTRGCEPSHTDDALRVALEESERELVGLERMEGGVDDGARDGSPLRVMLKPPPTPPPPGPPAVRAETAEEWWKRPSRSDGSRPSSGGGDGGDGHNSGAMSVELSSHVSRIRHTLPELGEGFVVACLEAYDMDVETVLHSLLERSLPPQLDALDRAMPYKAVPAKPSSSTIRANDKGKGKALPPTPPSASSRSPAPPTEDHFPPPPPPGPPPPPPPGPPPPRRRGEAAVAGIGGGVTSPTKQALGFANRVAPEGPPAAGSSVWQQYGTGPPQSSSAGGSSSYV